MDHDPPDLTRAFRLGIRDGLPFLIVIVPFGMLFGVLAGEAGWSLTEIMAMTILVIAGASQFTALQLLSEHAPLLIAIVTALAVNLRLAMYSASLAQYIGATPPLGRVLAAYCLTDQTYGISMTRLARGPELTPRERLAHFLGGAVPVCIPWYFATWLGTALGSAIPRWAARMLRYVPVAVMPALVAPLIAWPQATGGETDPARLLAALAALGFGVATRNVLASIFGGMAVLYLALWLVG